MAKKAAVKKKATKKKAPALVGTVKLLIGGKELKQSEYCESIAKGYEMEAAEVKKILLAVAGGAKGVEADPDLSAKRNKQIAGCFDKVAEDFAAHKEAKAEAEEAKEKAKVEADKEKEKAKELRKVRSSALATVRDKTLVAKPMEKLVADSVGSVLGKDFKVSAGGIAKNPKAIITDEGWAKMFGDMQSLYETAGNLREGIALRQAQVVRICRDEIGDDWMNFFSESLSDVARIKKYLRIVDTVKPILLGKVPLSNIRAVVEAKYDKEDKDNNLKLKADALAALEKEAKAKGGVTQVRAREIRDEFAIEDKEKKKPMPLIYLIPVDGEIKLVGAPKEDCFLAMGATLCIERARGIAFPIDAKGEFLESFLIEGPTPEITSYLHSLGNELEDDEEGETPDDEEVEEEVEETEEEWEEEEEEGDEEAAEEESDDEEEEEWD